MKRTIYIASVSMGKDSLAMLLRLIQLRYPLDVVVFYDSGMEFRAVYAIRDRVRELCAMYGIQFVELHPKESFLYCMLHRPVMNRDGSGTHQGYSWCGGPCRWATSYKIDAIQRFKKSLGPDVQIFEYIGIAADEKERLLKERRPDKVFPLVEWGWFEEDCLHYCWEQGYHWYEQTTAVPEGYIELYTILSRVSCWCCANKNEKELFNMWRYLPSYWEDLKWLQRQTSRPMKGYINGQPVGILELEEKYSSYEDALDGIKNHRWR